MFPRPQIPQKCGLLKDIITAEEHASEEIKLMSSTNEHFHPPPKPKMSPLDFRNTDLVSRLLAATPPYLYNMSLLPNTFFFSEMLRSLVQAKVAEQNRNTPGIHSQHRRSRKRTWSATRAECFQKQPSPKIPEKSSVENNDWMLKSNFPKEEIPLELTINKVDNNEQEKSLIYPAKLEQNNKPDIPMEHLFSNHTATNSENPSNLVLPPPPPMWYPPLYPAPPYGIDPLHFFIDLRVSGHIYDRKNNKDSTSTIVSPVVKEKSPSHSPGRSEEPISKLSKDFFKQSRHSSAFSVPVPSKKSPMNLTHLNQNQNESKQTKFDVKSMGFDKSSNKVSTNYIMNNINNIYSNVRCTKDETNEETTIKSDDEEKSQKKLKTLLDFEYVVDYMNSAKNSTHISSTESNNSSEVESIGSPALEVVAINDEN